MLARHTPYRRQPSARDGVVHPTRRSAFTLAELLVCLLVISVLLGLAALRVAPAADRSAVRAAVADAAAVFVAARNTAVYRRVEVAVTIDTSLGTVTALAESSVVLRRDLRESYGVRLFTSRDSTAFDPHGLGIGVANLSLVVRRGRAADTLFLSRLGRVRY